MSETPAPWIDVIEARVRRNVGRAMFAARWIMAPIYVGLLLALVMVAVKFVQKIVEAVPGFLALSTSDAIFLVLTLVDLSLVANLGGDRHLRRLGELCRPPAGVGTG